MAERRTAVALHIDPVACDGVGICAHLAPEVVRTDTWGYPMLTADPLTGDGIRQARAAVAACPRKALFLDPPR